MTKGKKVKRLIDHKVQHVQVKKMNYCVIYITSGSLLLQEGSLVIT